VSPGRPLPERCPSCGNGMVAPSAVCGACGVEVQGRFVPCPVCRLGGEDRRLFELFLRSRGNLKEVERALGISYPTVRQRTDDLLIRMGYPKGPPRDRMEILRRVREGGLSVDEAASLLRRPPEAERD